MLEALHTHREKLAEVFVLDGFPRLRRRKRKHDIKLSTCMFNHVHMKQQWAMQETRGNAALWAHATAALWAHAAAAPWAMTPRVQLCFN